MKIHVKLMALLLILSLMLTACGPLEVLGGNKVTVGIVYGSEKEEWLVPLVEEYNAQKQGTASGARIVVEATPMGSVTSGDRIVEGSLQPTVWSPASSAYIPIANANWRKQHGEDLVVDTPEDLVLSPVVIAMWRPMAEVLGWPETAIGWADIAELATSEEGWAAYGYPEWGKFKLGHTHPDFSNSGLISVIAEAYAGADKQRGLTLEDVQSAEVKEFMTAVESSIIHYGESTGFFASRMFERGPSYLSAAVMYENLVAAQESKRLAGEVSQLEVVAIYPREGTFWSNHPYAILNAPWVTDEQRAAAEDFLAFLLDRPQQLRAIEYGFRPADISIPLTAPLDSQHGVDPTQPQTVLEVPSAEVISAIRSLWQREAKKPVDVVVVMDISGSMKGKKIATARESLIQFIDVLDDRDRLQVIVFNTQLIPLTELSPLGEKRDDLRRRVSGITEGGGTRLYDAIQYAYDELQTNGDPDHIRALVVLSDGEDTNSTMNLDQLVASVGAQSESGDATKIFTIAFGDNADEAVLERISDVTGARQYDSDPETIHEVYAEISTFF